MSTSEKKHITRQLPVPMDDSAKELRSQELAQLVLDRTALELNLRDFSAGERKKIKDLKKSAKEAAEEIHAGIATREVPCVEESHFATNTVTVTRLDTKEVVETRKMSEDERQEPLPIDGAKGRKAKLALAPSPPVEPKTH